MASSTSAASLLSPNFQASGLASGLDTQGIIDNLVNLEGRSVTIAQTQQAAYQTQISAVGTLASKLQSLASATKDLGTSGVLGVAQVGTTSGVTATPGTSASAGTYAVQVNALATPAKARSAAFVDGTTVTGGTLSLSVQGSTYGVTIVDGSSLSAVALAINQSGAPVSATVLSTQGVSYLSLTNRNTGFTVGQDPSTALSITETSTGTQGQALGIATTQAATNASITVDGLTFERTSNTMSDVLPGVTLTATAQTSSPSQLVLAADTSATRSNIQQFVNAYNDLMRSVRSHLDVKTTDDTTKTLANDPSVRSLQSSLQSLVSGVLSNNPTVRSLSDVGVKTGSDGTLSIDSTRLSNALATDSQAVNALFQTASTGLAAKSDALSKQYTDSLHGLFTSRTQSLQSSVKHLDTTIGDLQLRLSGYRKKLVAEFTAMEKVVSSFKSLSNYLTQQTTSKTSSS